MRVQVRSPENVADRGQARVPAAAFEHFGEESAPDQEAARAQPPGRGPALGLQRTGERVRHRHQQQDQQRIRVVVPVDGHQGEHQRRDQRRPLARPAAHGAVQHQHPGHAFEHLRQDQRPAVHPEDLAADHLRPQRGRRLVDRDHARRIEGAEEEVGPVLPHRLQCRRVSVARTSPCSRGRHGLVGRVLLLRSTSLAHDPLQGASRSREFHQSCCSALCSSPARAESA